jgi:integrase
LSDLKDLQRQIAELNAVANRMAGDQPTLLFADYAREYLKAKLQNPTLRTSTKNSFQNQVMHHLIPAFGLLPMDRIKNGEWLHWVTDMREQKQISAFFNARKVLIEILRAAQNDGHIQKLQKFDNPDEPHDVGRILSTQEILAIIWKSHRPFRFIFFTFWKLGCRPREILRYEWEMLDWETKDKAWANIPARISKTGRQRRIAINPRVGRILEIRRARGYRPSPFLFPSKNNPNAPQLSYQSAFEVACRRAQVKGAKVYDFRRTFITRCAAENKPLAFIAKHLDTSIGQIEKTYLKAQKEAMEAIVR